MGERSKYREELDQNAMNARVDLAAETLGIPAEVAERVKRQGTNPKYTRSTGVLVEFAATYGLSLDWLLCNDVRPMLHYASDYLKRHDAKAAS